MLYTQAKVWEKQPGLTDRAILIVSDYQSGPAEYVFPHCWPVNEATDQF